MHVRLWNSFNLLGVILLGVGLFGLLSGGKMVFDPGRVSRGNEWMIYSLAGVLMFVNGFLPSPNPLPGKAGGKAVKQ